MIAVRTSVRSYPPNSVGGAFAGRRFREAHVDLHLARLARDLSVLLHQPRVLLAVHAETALARELLGQLDREAIRRLQRERVLAGDRAPCRRLVEELHAALERLGEPLLL